MHIRVKLFLTITCLLIGALGFGQAKDSKNAEITRYLDSLHPKEFSGTILVAHQDTLLEKRAYGLSSIEYGGKNKINTKFNIASITKLFTAVAALQLYQQGKIDLKQPVGTYLPEYSNSKVRNKVTVHQLLTHTSGLNNFYVTALDHIKNSEYKEISDFAPLFEKDTLLSEPGTKYDYSGSGFVILGLIIEQVSGENYYDYIQNHILEPANMLDTSEIQVDSIVKNKASGYTSNFGQSTHLKRNDYYLTKASPAGFYYSTIEDVFKFSKALRNHKLLSKATTDLMLEPKVKGYNTHLGYGIDIDKRYNQSIIGHSGGWYGIHCELLDFMDDQYTVVILSNIDDGGDQGASKVADFFKMLIAGKETDK